jgi:diguanylate cyclase (GGDEF)-like protein
MRTVPASRLLGADRAPQHRPIRPKRDEDGLAAGPVAPVEPPARAASLLCEDESTRQRLLDMEVHLHSARLAAFAMLSAGALILAPWVGWSPLLAVVVSFIAFSLAGARMSRSARPEYWFMGAWSVSQAAIGVAILMTGGPHSVFLPWLAIHAVKLSMRFKLRGVIVGVLWTILVMLAVTVGVSPAAVAAHPERLIVALVLLGGVVVLSTALMRSDVKHRADAIIDPLTGLFNRQALAARAGEILKQGSTSAAPLAVLIGDLDHFKRVNDRHGHHVGDAVLREVASVLRVNVRTLDYICRYGGEEFVILLPRTDEARALAAAERVRRVIAAAHPAELELTMSIGVSVAGRQRIEFDDLLIAADRALYRAKVEGRNRVCLGRAYDGVRIELPDASIAARSAERHEAQDGQAGTQAGQRETPAEQLEAQTGQREATPAEAFALARRMFLKGEPVELASLAERLDVPDERLADWCGDRESLLGEVIAGLSTDLLIRAKAEHSGQRGAARVLAVYEQFASGVANFRPLHLLLQTEPQQALTMLTSSGGHVHPAAVSQMHALLIEERARGALQIPEGELQNLAYAIVRLAEAFLYDDAVLATEPQIQRTTRIVARLLD